MQPYTVPALDIIEFEAEDVITTSVTPQDNEMIIV